MGGSLYNKIPVGRRSTLLNLSRVKIAAAVGVIASVGLILLIENLVK